ncbi:MAG: glycosyltransferase family 1 protein [Chloroflexi bacterium]|nr:MAG: glycosyltransferase family 1 protein [Chloroflexota bacterium]
MTRLLYLANMRLPTEKAHGLQIVQNCEAFADLGLAVELWAARRFNVAALRHIDDVWSHYGVRHNFVVRRIPCIDLMPLVPNQSNIFSHFVFHLQLLTYVAFVFLRLLVTRAEFYYTRELWVVLAASLIKPRQHIVYEVHRLNGSRVGRRLQAMAARRAGTLIPITQHLADGLIERGAKAERILVAHDGIRAERFADVPSQSEARAHIGWPQEAFIVGYVGRLQTMFMDKGVGTLLEALSRLEGVSLALVGGPDEIAQQLSQQWRESGLDEARFLYVGHVPPGEVPRYLSAFDVCAMPLPFTTHFAYYTSALKLFEYMAAQRPIVVSDLPSVNEVVTHEETALLVPPGDVDALAAAIRRLRDDDALRTRLATRAHELVMTAYTWQTRARRIIDFARQTQTQPQRHQAPMDKS